MQIMQSWKRNDANSISDESITLTITYSSFDKSEIDKLQQKMPEGILIMDSEPPKEKHE